MKWLPFLPRKQEVSDAKNSVPETKIFVLLVYIYFTPDVRKSVQCIAIIKHSYLFQLRQAFMFCPPDGKAAAFAKVFFFVLFEVFDASV